MLSMNLQTKAFFQVDKGIFCDISEIKLCQTNCDRFYNSQHIPHSSNSSQSEHVSRFKSQSEQSPRSNKQLEYRSRVNNILEPNSKFDNQSEQSSKSNSQLEYSSRVNNILEPDSKFDNQSEHSSRSNSQSDYSSRVNNILELEHNSRFCSQSEDDSRCNSQLGKRLGSNLPRSRNNNSTLESLSRCSDQSEVSLSSELLAVPKSDFSSKLKGQFTAPSNPAFTYSNTTSGTDSCKPSTTSNSSLHHAFRNQSDALFRDLGKLGLEDIRQGSGSVSFIRRIEILSQFQSYPNLRGIQIRIRSK